MISFSLSNEMDTTTKKSILPSAIIVLLFVAGLIGASRFLPAPNSGTKIASNNNTAGSQSLEQAVLPEQIVLPIRWGDLGKKMSDAGVIDAEKFEKLYESRGGLGVVERKMLYETNNGEIIMTPENSGIILNMLWAFGLGNKNEILERGPMMDPNYGGAGNFASTGGWTVARGDAMDHYSMHKFITLTADQQTLVEKVSQNIYRPCCGNSTYFPDCNHGMAMLGLLEILASQGMSEEDMYKIALRVNSYWFPDTYLTIAQYMQKKGVAWDDVDPKEMLSAEYSSGSGFRQIASQVTTPSSHGGGGGCGVGGDAPAPKQSSGCGVGGDTPPPVAKPRPQSGCGV
ncbi:MAG: hypothetical protein US50_C0056G0002 [Candidatus Nomurabacteria bacterium GW2011_GWB1_37_5]|uniref:Uncharacterized protein n=1 Tax=Candidatus Nomurabacteria bacterium GW2011_GWB1_37_5 TaxID=1618742 RepID=A0A0G0JBS2_9BACT|nr:MAG: hypothetical protein US50_C0056G0002 [Candidatus Nomurabacteria bacterium GW2011_GWB1_37_5]